MPPACLSLRTLLSEGDRSLSSHYFVSLVVVFKCGQQSSFGVEDEPDPSRRTLAVQRSLHGVLRPPLHQGPAQHPVGPCRAAQGPRDWHGLRPDLEGGVVRRSVAWLVRGPGSKCIPSRFRTDVALERVAPPGGVVPAVLQAVRRQEQGLRVKPTRFQSRTSRLDRLPWKHQGAKPISHWTRLPRDPDLV